jgi:hypothetical protein
MEETGTNFLACFCSLAAEVVALEAAAAGAAALFSGLYQSGLT